MSYTRVAHVLAVDPGPTWMGWAVLRVEYSPGVRCTFLRGGRSLCDRATFADVLARELNDAMAAEGSPPLHLVVETPAGYAFIPARVPHLLSTAWVAGGMAWLAEWRGLRVARITAQQVRKVLAGKANADDSLVKITVRGHVFGAPTNTNDHVYDALAVGVVGAWSLVGQVVLPEVHGGSDGKKRSSTKQGPQPDGAATQAARAGARRRRKAG